VALHQVPGVIDATVGYAGGTIADRSYEQVCTRRTGPAEVVHVEYDPAQVRYEQLLDVFFANHDPTQLDRQGPGCRHPVPLGDLLSRRKQAEAARAAKRALQASGRHRRPVVTEIAPFSDFFWGRNTSSAAWRSVASSAAPCLTRTAPVTCRVPARDRAWSGARLALFCTRREMSVRTGWRL
jgi:peptide-methionine (S)-S-oxide reductase